jgi:hypothetical protein
MGNFSSQCRFHVLPITFAHQFQLNLPLLLPLATTSVEKWSCTGKNLRYFCFLQHHILVLQLVKTTWQLKIVQWQPRETSDRQERLESGNKIGEVRSFMHCLFQSNDIIHFYVNLGLKIVWLTYFMPVLEKFSVADKLTLIININRKFDNWNLQETIILILLLMYMYIIYFQFSLA